MKWRDKTGWVSFVHNLFYPAILGSMIYDIFPLREINIHYDLDFSEIFKFFFKLTVVCCYCIDYIHFHQNLLPHDFEGEYTNLRKHHILLDALIALVFRIAFWGVQIGLYWLTLLAFIALVLSVQSYMPGNPKERKFYKIILAAIFVFLLSIPVLTTKFVSFLSVIFITGGYFCYSFFLYDKWNLSESLQHK